MKKSLLYAALLITGASCFQGSQAEQTLKEGDRLPSLSFVSDEGKTVSLQDYRGRWLVLYFYPKDDSPGCTVQAQTFSELYDGYQKANGIVFGINTDSTDSHRRFKAKHQLRVSLLTDPEGNVAGMFGIRVILGLCARDSVLVKPDGTIEKIFRGVNPRGNPHEILEYIQAHVPAKSG